MKRTNALLTTLLFAAVLFGLALFAWISPPQSYSYAERRALAQKPQLTAKTVENGTFMSSFDSYSMDQFPARDGFRSLKAVLARYVFARKDNNGLYSVNGYVSRLEYPLNESRMTAAGKKLRQIGDTYLAGTDCTAYLCVIPDKNIVMGSESGYPAIDLQQAVFLVQQQAEIPRVISIEDLLTADDFYRTDQHWRQEAITDIADRIGSAMLGSSFSCRPEDYEEKTLEQAFTWAYASQAALPFAPDTIRYLTDPVLEACTVTSYNTGVPKEAFVYDLEKAAGKDPYELFLSGSDALLVIENPACEAEKELVVFRDSFGSCLVPLLAEGYRKITVVDLRYLRSEMLSQYIEFTDQDVLFLYSTLVLNNSIAL